MIQFSTTYDQEADALYLRLAPEGTAVAETREVEAGVQLDFDDAGHLVGIEVLSVSKRERMPAVHEAIAQAG